jgi:hypothetical protein
LGGDKQILVAKPAVPAMFHASTDSRREALKHYRQTTFNGETTSLYFDATKDTLLFPTQGHLRRFTTVFHMKPAKDHDIRFVVVGRVTRAFSIVNSNIFPGLQSYTLGKDTWVAPTTNWFRNQFERNWLRCERKKKNVNTGYTERPVASLEFIQLSFSKD